MPAPAPTKPATETAPPAAPDPENIEFPKEAKDRFVSLFEHGRTESDEPAAAPAPPPATPALKAKKDVPAAPAVPEVPTVEEPPTPEPKATKVKKRRDVDPLELASRAGAAAAQELISRQPAPAPKAEPVTPAPPPDEVPAKYARKLVILEQMAADNPERYGSIVSDFKRSIRRVDEYQSQWERNNPGRKFDPDADEHNAFFDVNDIDYEDSDYAEAVVAVRTKPLAEKAAQADKLAEKLDAIERKEKQRAMEPGLQQVRTSAAADTVKLVDPAILDHAKTPESLKAYIDGNPEEADIVLGHAQMAGELVAEGARILDGGELNDKSPATQEFFRLKNDLEQRIKAQPVDDQYDERGRRFVTWQEWVTLSAKDSDSVSKYWFLGKAELSKLIPHEAAQIAKAKVKEMEERLERYAKARGYTKADAAPPGAKGKVVELAKPSTPAPAPAAPAGQARTQIDPVPQPTVKPDEAGWRNNLVSIFSGTRV